MAVAASYVHFQNEKKKKNKNEVNEHYYQIGEKKKKRKQQWQRDPQRAPLLSIVDLFLLGVVLFLVV